ncbi:hypothetical protein Tsubulata_015709 [Turnera subulata]|uniref:RRM domain-containing protein n=1 Tax=Turnera subulata TaxID=218843 RepID=A0A9Q0J650_9ROSI|nr:hypothetical protein Tsubulata_015709 [Turnera subulata]
MSPGLPCGLQPYRNQTCNPSASTLPLHHSTQACNLSAPSPSYHHQIWPENAQTIPLPKTLPGNPNPQTFYTHHLPLSRSTTNHQPQPQPYNKPLQFSRWNRRTIQAAVSNNQVTSLYVSNIPRRWSPTDIHLVMSKYGDVMDVFIPAKPNKWGKRYAFVRFKNNVNATYLTQRINSMVVDGERIWSCLARGRSGSLKASEGRQKPFENQRNAQDHRSFVDVVRTNEDRPVKQSNFNNGGENSVSSFIPKDGDAEWLQRCAFGILKMPMPFGMLKDLLINAALPIDKVIPLGGVSFLLKFLSTSAMMEMVANVPTVLSRIFDEFRPWREGDSASNRLCWVLVKGIPPNAWNMNFFRLISSCVRKMVDWSMETGSKERMDVAEVLVLTSNNTFINKVLSVKIGGNRYEIGLFETHNDSLDWTWSSPSSDCGVLTDAGGNTRPTLGDASAEPKADAHGIQNLIENYPRTRSNQL